jgi:hypothetical protein
LIDHNGYDIRSFTDTKHRYDTKTQETIYLGDKMSL